MRVLRVYLALSLVAVFAGVAGAESLLFELDVVWNNATPEGDGTVPAPPWLIAEFDDGGTAGSVDLTLTANNLSATEFTGEWYFNIDPVYNATDLSNLTFTVTSTTGAFDNPTISKDINNLQANGNGKFDILLGFSTADGGMDYRFSDGDVLEYSIGGIGSLTAGSFNFISYEDGGEGEYFTTAHIQGIGVGLESGWITVPEPVSMLLLAMGGVAIFRKRKV